MINYTNGHYLSKVVVFILVLLIGSRQSKSQPLQPYKNPALSIDVRVRDLISKMTNEEKFWQLFMIPGEVAVGDSAKYKHGILGFQVSAGSNGAGVSQQILNYNTSGDAALLARKINSIQKYFIEDSRLGIPIIAFDEALHGLVRDDATVFPQSIGLAATWDTSLVSRVAQSIAEEAKSRGIRQILSPVINIAADVRWGRTEETYGEDPFLVSAMGVAYIGAFERMNVIATPKHFVANVGDGGRDSYPINYDKRILDEIYLVPFKAAIEQAGARSIMTAYNSVGGLPCSANPWLLTGKLKDEWKFKGFVISDAGGVGGATVLHYTAKDYPQSGELAVRAGLDVIFQTEYQHYSLFIPPFLDGKLEKPRIDDAVSRVLRAKFELGLFDHPYVDEKEASKFASTNAHKEVAKKAALESIVLLKNAENVLPLSDSIKSIAVIGVDATEARLGGYSGPGNGRINVLDGIKQRAGTHREVLYAPGCGRKDASWEVIAPNYLSPSLAQGAMGLTGEYFDNISLSGTPRLIRTDPTIDFLWTLSSPDSSIKSDFFSARWNGTIRCPKTGNFKIGIEGNDGFRLYINNHLLIDNWEKASFHARLKNFYFEKDKEYKIRIEFFEPVGNARVKLIWNADSVSEAGRLNAQAIELSRKADVVVLVAGIEEGEFRDRASLALPGRQEDLINGIAATGKPVIIILVGGSAITMSGWMDQVKGIVDAWYPGEQGGPAIAAILFGDYSPGGRLPITFPISEGQLPLVYNHRPTGRGDDYMDLTGLPLFPFGYGMSYSQFAYDSLRIDRAEIGIGDSAEAECLVRNSGKMEADEVVQLYIRAMITSVATPVMELKGFQRIHLRPQESMKVSFKIKPSMLAFLDQHFNRVIEPGQFQIRIGSSSRDIRLKATLSVHG